MFYTEDTTTVLNTDDDEDKLLFLNEKQRQRYFSGDKKIYEKLQRNFSSHTLPKEKSQ